MKTIAITGNKREALGKSSSRKLRKEGLVPCVVYGGKEPLHFSTDSKSFKNLVYTNDAHMVDLDVDGTKIPSILQDIAYHPVTDEIIHADFYELDDNKTITMEIPVRLTGNSKGVMLGGSLRFLLRKLTITSIPSDMPDEILIDITELKIGSKTQISTITTEDQKYIFEHPANSVIVAVKTSRKAISEESQEEEETAEATPVSEG